MASKINEILVQPSISIREAMKTLDKTVEKCLIVVNENINLLGTLTDGDIRRSILAGIDFSATIENSFFTDPTILTIGKYTKDIAIKLLRTKKLDLIPIVDEKCNVLDYVTWSSLGEKNKEDEKSLSDVPVVIMAGGRGTRLEPFTKILPKPLVPIHEKPIIEHIIERFTAIGCNVFHITVNYKSKILQAYFEELTPDYSVHFVKERKPLGTAGGLQYLARAFKESLFVTNCDIIIKTDYTSLYAFHQKGNYDITLVASMKNYIIPYGTCELNGEGHLKQINEKPKYDFLVNTGLYVINPDVLFLIPKGKRYDITHLIEDVKNQGGKIGVYPIDDNAWIDIGQWSEYKKVVDNL